MAFNSNHGNYFKTSINDLDAAYSIPFIKYFEGLSYAEIAKELDLPVGTVKSRIQVARQALRDNFKMYSKSFGKAAIAS
ncbi:RNA polymerase sigma factor [Pedobacter sp. PWIIR3]